MGVRSAKIGEPFYDIVTVFDLDGIATVTGETPGDFTVTFIQDDAVQVLAYTITEVGTTGHYALRVGNGFPSGGLWTIVVVVGYNSSTWRSTVEVRQHDIDEVYSLVSAAAGSELVTILVTDASNGDAPVADVLVSIYNADGNTFITSGRTDASGTLVTSLDADDYLVALYQPGIIATPAAITVAEGGGTFPIEVISVHVDPPSSPELCRFYADFTTFDGLPFEGFRLKVENLFDPASAELLRVGQQQQTYTTDENGHVEFDVVRGMRIRVSFVTAPLTRELMVPDQEVQNLVTAFGVATDAFQVVRRP